GAVLRRQGGDARGRDIGEVRLEEPARGQLHLVIALEHELARSQGWQIVVIRRRIELMGAISALRQPRAVEAEADRTIGRAGDRSEGRETAAEVLPGMQGVGVVGADLIETTDAAVVDTRPAKPEPLGSEQVHASGTLRGATCEVGQLAGLPPDAHPEIAGL